MEYENYNVYIIVGILLVCAGVIIFPWLKKMRKKKQHQPIVTVNEPQRTASNAQTYTQEVKEMPGVELDSNTGDSDKISAVETDISKIENVGSDKPFAKLKANSIGEAPVEKKKTPAKKTAKKKTAKPKSAGSATKKRTTTKPKKDETI